MKTLKTLSKVLFVTLLITGLSVDASAQKKAKKAKKEKKAKTEEVIERPAKVGNGDVDSFVSSSFDIYEKNQEITKTLSDAANSADKAGDMKADLDKQMEDVKALLAKSKAAGDAASGMPMKDKPKAVKAVKAATKALNATQAAIPGQLEMIKSQGAAQ